VKEKNINKVKGKNINKVKGKNINKVKGKKQQYQQPSILVHHECIQPWMLHVGPRQWHIIITITEHFNNNNRLTGHKHIYILWLGSIHPQAIIDSC